MEKTNRYKQIVREILELLATRVPVNKPFIKKHLVIDEKKNEFVLISLGRDASEHHYNVTAHVEIKNGKILIHEESIDPSIFERLTDRGVVESDIIPVYLRDYA
jgi:XisI protein